MSGEPVVGRWTTRRFGLSRNEVVTSGAAVAVSSGCYLAFGHPYLARGVVGDLIAVSGLGAVLVCRRARGRHEALLCLAGVGAVNALAPSWPLQVPDRVWWAAIGVGLAGYLTARRRFCD